LGLVGMSRYAATTLIVALSPGHSDITIAQTTGTVNVFDPRSGILGPTSPRASACPNLPE